MRRTLLVLIVLSFLVPIWGTGQEENGSQGDLEIKPVRILVPGDKVADQDRIAAYIAEISGAETGAKIEWMITSWGDYRSKVQVLLAAGDPFELCYDADWLTFGINVSKGAYMDITDLLKYETPELYSKFTEDEWESVSYHGRIYGVPWIYPKTERRSFRIREDLRIKYNLPVPKSMEDFELYLKTIKENENIMPFMYTGDGALNDFMTDYGIAGLGSESLDLFYYIEDDKIKIYPAEDLPIFNEVIERAYHWYQEGYVPVDVVTARANRTYKMSEGNLASIYFLNEGDDKDSMLLQSKGISGVVKTYPDYSVVSFRCPASNNMYAVNANAENPVEALKLLQWIHSSQDNFDKIMYGIEGEHWTLDNNLVNILPSIESSKYYNWPAPWAMWDINYLRPIVGESVDKYFKAKEHAMKNTIAAPLGGFFPDFTKIKTEVALRTALRDEVGVGLEYGIFEPSEIESYRVKQSKHTAIIIEELQKQLNEWLAITK